ADDGIGAEGSGGEDAGVGPGAPAVEAVGVAGLAEVGRDTVELAPADRDAVGRGWVDHDARLVGRIAEDVLAVGADVGLADDGDIVGGAAVVRGRVHRPVRRGWGHDRAALVVTLDPHVRRRAGRGRLLEGKGAPGAGHECGDAGGTAHAVLLRPGPLRGIR